MLADLLRQNRTDLRTRWRRLEPGRQALLVLAHLRKGETYADLAWGFGVGTTTVYRYLREALDLLAAMAPTLAQAIEVAGRKAYVILDARGEGSIPGRARLPAVGLQVEDLPGDRDQPVDGLRAHRRSRRRTNMNGISRPRRSMAPTSVSSSTLRNTSLMGRAS
jgi:Helix-turn-helix of DDE superfamily endonuclease